MNLASPFSLSLIAIVALSLMGFPVAHAMIGGSILYLFLAGLDMGTAAEQLLNGMMGSQLGGDGVALRPGRDVRGQVGPWFGARRHLGQGAQGEA